ncbi:Ribose-phosphate pyrophosphokinase [Paraliobacillus sp. PM-2]|uniref:ComF family protein n=1 Tax=Paraliobacillus sp. PM-2 TaxID=1462524 RepID=UPI00061BFF1C|nr:ComF family protein [Paraliobacillus sp. PM-2]CQR46393.1 Ribose-phosphate pyrophosphokinase [Paraliobacillus sp. PM-2]
MECIWCQQLIYPEVTWSTLFIPEKITPLCKNCQAELQPIERIDCFDCGRQYNEKATKGDVRCTDCQRWHQENKHYLTRNRSVFQYNKQIQAMITKWKYRGDYSLIEAFADQIQQYFQTYYNDLDENTIIVPIPLSDQRLHERAFNQAEVIAEQLPLPIHHLLRRIHGEKQAKRSRKERLAISNPFQLYQPTNQPVLLIDDIYTTGTTLHHAAQILKQGGCPTVYAYTLAR